jgi:hypothetical protein
MTRSEEEGHMLHRQCTSAVLFVIVFGAAFPRLSAAQIRLCPWKATAVDPPRGETNRIVEWGSTADPSGGLWNFSAFVVNVDTTGPPNIHWGAAGMRVEALQPNHFAVVCHPDVRGRNDRSGPLFFARDRSSVSTVVYAGGAPPRDIEVVAGKPLSLSTRFIVAGRGSSSRDVDVRVTTTIARTDSGYTSSTPSRTCQIAM